MAAISDHRVAACTDEVKHIPRKGEEERLYIAGQGMPRGVIR